MIEKEARKVISIMLSADVEEYCHIAAAQIISAFSLVFPEFTEIAKEMYQEEFKASLVDMIPRINCHPTRWIPNRWR